MSFTMDQILRVGAPFNPVSAENGQGEMYTGENQNRLFGALAANGWNDPRFVSADEVEKHGWTLKGGAVATNLQVKGADGQWTPQDVYNAADVIGMPSIDEMRKLARERLAVHGTDNTVASTASVVDQLGARSGAPAESGADIEASMNQPSVATDSLESDSPTDDQIAAVALFREKHGKHWKDDLASVWANGTYSKYGIDSNQAALLQQVRNQFGPEWLEQVGVDDLARTPGSSEKVAKEPLAAATDSIDPDLGSENEGDELAVVPMLRTNDKDQVVDARPTPEYVPLPVLGRIFKERTPGSGEYVRAGEKKPAFVDKGDRVVVRDKKEDAYQAVMELAKAKGWESIQLAGKPEQIARGWLEAQLLGIRVVNYTPTEKDLAELDRRQKQLAEASQLEVVAVEEKRDPPSGAKLVTVGRHVGAIADLQDGYAIQSVGRGQFVAHELSKFDTPPNVGDKLDIQYRAGRPQLMNTQEKGRGVGHER